MKLQHCEEHPDGRDDSTRIYGVDGPADPRI